MLLFRSGRRTALIWMHAAILIMDRGIKKSQYFPELGNSTISSRLTLGEK
jgi:hypothetical protein